MERSLDLACNVISILMLLVDQLVVEGKFDFVEQFCYDHPQLFTHEAWRGRMRTCNGVGSSSLSPQQVENFDKGGY